RETDGPDMTERRNQKVTDFFWPLPFVELDAVHGRHRAKACQSGLWNACRPAGIDDSGNGLGIDGSEIDLRRLLSFGKDDKIVFIFPAERENSRGASGQANRLGNFLLARLVYDHQI